MSLYEHLPGPKIVTELETAELIKYVDNAWHALKVAFGNEVGLLAKTLGINSQEVMDIFFEDKKLNISEAYLRPGFAFGGSCLPKDLRALNYICRKLDLSLPVLNHVLDSNRMLIERGVDWILGQSKKPHCVSRNQFQVRHRRRARKSIRRNGATPHRQGLRDPDLRS